MAHKMSDKEKLITWGRRATGRSSSSEKRKKEYKDKKVCGENAWGKVIEKLEFKENG